MKRTRLGIAAAIAFMVCLCASAQTSLSIQSGVRLSWIGSTGNTYQTQWSPARGSEAWSDLGAAVSGSGSTHFFHDVTPYGARRYRVLEMVPGTTAAPALPVNGGFELGNGLVATNWNAGGSRPPVRINVLAHSGSFSIRCALTNVTASPLEGTLSQLAVAQGGAVIPGQAYTFSFWARQVAAGPSYLQQYQVQWLNNVAAVVGGSGLVNFTGTVGSWTQVSVPNLTAPANAAEVRIFFRFATGAVAGGHGEVFIDDVLLTSNGGGSGPGETNVMEVATEAVARISWPTSVGTEYQAESSIGLGTGTWTNLQPPIIGDGGARSFLAPISGSQTFFRVRSPSVALQPPTQVRVIAAGLTNAIGLAWNASATPGVLGYRVHYGLASDSVTNVIQVGNVTTATISGLMSGQTYQLAVVAFTADAESQPSNTLFTQPEATIGIVPLFNANTLLEPPTTLHTSNALITHVADRARDRHARESMFNAYDHYLSWYWEERTIAIEIIDRVAKGGTGITFNYTTLTPLGAPEFRAFFRGINTPAEYHFNLLAPLVGPNVYRATINTKLPENRPLQIGDRVEIEISQFIEAAQHGRNNYYGTAILYVVGRGIVPWEGQGPLLDSHPLPEAAWLGGETTLPYQYSNEPEHRFKQTAGNIAPTNAQPFMLGRRLHHTDFGTGAHSEPGNPVFTNHVGKLGPRFIARSCVECHVNNGRALPPAIGAPMPLTVVKVGSDASGSPHPTLGSILQPQATIGTAEGSATISSYSTIEGQYADGTSYSLRKPIYTFQGTAPSHFSARLAPALVGLGLLEAVGEETILALADPDDSDADGISGRAQTVRDPETGELRLGRFTSKAGKARLSHQIAGALNTDMGVATEIFPLLDGETTNRAPELSRFDLDLMTRYVALLGAGARRDLTNAEAIQGEQLFNNANCVKCHVSTLATSSFYPMTELRNQVIHPYTDLLLHDMGAGLADNMGELDATGSEWRTPPLWGIGLTAGVSGGEAYLHDGRARTVEEAILWHGGEAENAKEAFRTMSAADRAALVRFLKSL